MSKNKVLLLSSFLLCFLITNGKDIQVCPNCKVKTIKAAITSAKRNDKIIVKQGIYKEHDIILDKKISIIGLNYPIIDGEHVGEIFHIKTDSCSIEGLKIMNVGQSYTKDYAAILIHKSHHFKIKNNILENVFFGILIEKSHDGIISNNTISSSVLNESASGNGIHMWHSSNILVKNNYLFGLRDGIYFEFVSESIIAHNKSHNNLRYGLHFMFSNHNEYYENNFNNNGAGVAVMFSKFIIMHHNTFSFNWGSSSYGLLLKEIYDAEIYDNTFEQNTIGINAEGSTRINYTHNNFIRNGWALKIAGACYANKFKENNFSSNALDLSYNSKLNDNTFNNNYWSEYTGYDLNKDGIGDIPYRPVKLFSYIVNRTPESIILLRSLFVDIINFSEKVSPVFTPDELVDNFPLIKKYND